MPKTAFTPLEQHLAEENPLMLNAARSFFELDDIARGLGLITGDYSTASEISWWPVISLLGTFSAGKSTFVNDFLGTKVQRTGNQAVDDKFTVLCYAEGEPKTLPGIALDADPRFPFFRISKEIEQALRGEGQRINAYLQLKTCASDKLKGKILIDSPGFDADVQRDAVLRITSHIIDISDLVLIFFDARHPESGAMRDTLRELVGGTVKRADSDKFLYILNQMDTTAREDNPEEVVAAWQRALAGFSLTAGRFYTIYSEYAAIPIEDELLWRRYQNKRDHDLKEIRERMQRVEIERGYRVLRTLDQYSTELSETALPVLVRAVRRFRARLRAVDFIIVGALLGGIALSFTVVPLPLLAAPPVLLGAGTLLAVVLVVVWARLHLWSARALKSMTMSNLRKKQRTLGLRWNLANAFDKHTAPWPIFQKARFADGGREQQSLIESVREKVKNAIQALNDLYTRPSG